MKASRVDVAAGVLRRLGCTAYPLNVTGGQVAQPRGAVDPDALGDDPLQVGDGNPIEFERCHRTVCIGPFPG